MVSIPGVDGVDPSPFRSSRGLSGPVGDGLRLVSVDRRQRASLEVGKEDGVVAAVAGRFQASLTPSLTGTVSVLTAVGYQRLPTAKKGR